MLRSPSKDAFGSPQISALRLARHHLTGPDRPDLVSICRDVCGIQAQLSSAAEIALWARRHNLSRTDIRSALWKTRALVKTYCMRGTLHLIPAAEFPFYISALKRSRLEAALRILARFGVTQKEAARMTEGVVKALSAGPMTQGDLIRQALPKADKKLKAYADLVWSVFRPAFVEGLICYGPVRGQEVSFVRADEWLPRQEQPDELEAQRMLLRSYVGAYGPATLQDFSRWTGIPSSQVKTIRQSLEAELVEVNVGETVALILDKDRPLLSNRPSVGKSLHLLPSFDPYLLGHVDKSHLVTPSRYKSVFRGQGWISPVLLLDGTVGGIWSQARRGKRLSVKVMPFKKLSRRIRSNIEEEAAGLARFLEAPHEISFSEPS